MLTFFCKLNKIFEITSQKYYFQNFEILFKCVNLRESFYNISKRIKYLLVFKNISESWICNVTMKYFAMFNENVATIFQLQWSIGNISDIFMQYSVLTCRSTSPGTNPQMALVISNSLHFSKELTFKWHVSDFHVNRTINSKATVVKVLLLLDLCTKWTKTNFVCW